MKTPANPPASKPSEPFQKGDSASSGTALDRTVAATEGSELAMLRDEVSLLRSAAESRWHEIAALTRMVQSLETEKINNRSAYDRDRRALESEIASLRRAIKKSGGKAPAKSESLRGLSASDGEWEQMYYAVLNSTSWKLTRPVRVLSNIARRLLRRG